MDRHRDKGANMTTDTEALRAQFEATIEATFGSRPYVLD